MVVPSYFDLETSGGSPAVSTTSCRSGDLRIEPGEIKAFYCSMDENLWNKTGNVVFYDREGNRYPVAILNKSGAHKQVITPRASFPKPAAQEVIQGTLVPDHSETMEGTALTMI